MSLLRRFPSRRLEADCRKAPRRRPVGVTLRVADLLDWTPRLPVGSKTSDEDLRLARSIQVVPCEINPAVFGDHHRRVEYLSSRVGVNQLTRAEASTAVFRNGVIKTGLANRAAKGEPGHMEITTSCPGRWWVRNAGKKAPASHHRRFPRARQKNCLRPLIFAARGCESDSCLLAGQPYKPSCRRQRR